MNTFRNKLKRLRAPVASSIALLLLSSCAHPTPELRADNIVTIQGRATMGYSESGAMEKILNLAAKITVDHGFRYFRLAGIGGASAIRPGTNVSIKLYAERDAAQASAQIWDANAILMKGVPRSAVQN